MMSNPIPVPSPWRAFFALILFSFRRQWRVRQLAIVAFGLLTLMAAIVAIITNGPVGWRLENRTRLIASMTKEDERIRMTYKEYGEDRLVLYQTFPGPTEAFGIKSAVVASYRAMMNDRKYLDDYAFLNFARWTVFALFIGFLLPLFTLAYATGSLGSERESRTLIWLVTRPLPRWAIYLAKFLGVLPWSVAVSTVAFIVLCLAGGSMGRKAILIYWQPVIAGAIGFTAFFHLVGAVVRRPAVVGLVYVFFYETLVANLPGSLKQFSMGYYVRSLFYDRTAEVVSAIQPESVNVFAPAEPTTAWLTIIFATIVLTGIGMYLFGRQEPKEET